jgi:hypothetical protein
MIGESEMASTVNEELLKREQEEDYLSDGRDAVDGDVTDSDAEFENICDVDDIIVALLEYNESHIR